MLKQLENLNPDILAHYRKTGQSAAIPDDVKQYIDHLDYAAQLYHVHSNITTCAKLLKQRFPKHNIALNTARQLVYESIEYFHLNSTVSLAAWDQHYADKFEDLARVAIAADDYTSAQKCYEKAHTLRTKNRDASIDPKNLQPPVMLFTTDLSATSLGFEKKSQKDIAADYEKGKYTNLVNNLKASDEDKKRLFDDIGISDAIEITDDEPIDYED